MTEKALAVRSTAITSAARFQFDTEQLALIKRTVAQGAPDAELLLFLELSARYGLDPFAKHIYLAKMAGRDGDVGQWATIVSRDGLLALANRDPTFEGMEGDVVRQGDMIARTADGFVHTYDATEAADRITRPIVSGWARVHRAGRKPTFFNAPFSAYVRGNKVWRQYPDAMILKVAEGMALRKAFSITGLIAEDEIGASYSDTAGGVVDMDTSEEAGIDYGTDEQVAAKLRYLFTAANELRPGAFHPQKIRLRLAGASQADRLQLIGELEGYITRHGGTVAYPGEEAPVTDAEVVSEPEDAS